MITKLSRYSDRGFPLRCELSFFVQSAWPSTRLQMGRQAFFTQRNVVLWPKIKCYFFLPPLGKICGKVISTQTSLQTQPFRPERTDLQLTALSIVKGQCHEMFIFPRWVNYMGNKSLTDRFTFQAREDRSPAHSAFYSKGTVAWDVSVPQVEQNMWESNLLTDRFTNTTFQARVDRSPAYSAFKLNGTVAQDGLLLFNPV